MADKKSHFHQPHGQKDPFKKNVGIEICLGITFSKLKIKILVNILFFYAPKTQLSHLRLKT